MVSCWCSCVCPSVRLSYLHIFISVNINGFSSNGMCIDIMEIWFVITNGQILSIFNRVICVPYDNGGVLSFHVFIKIIFSSKCLRTIPA